MRQKNTCFRKPVLTEKKHISNEIEEKIAVSSSSDSEGSIRWIMGKCMRDAKRPLCKAIKKKSDYY